MPQQNGKSRRHSKALKWAATAMDLTSGNQNSDAVFHIFCDESHTDGKHAFRVQGGIWVPDGALRDVRAAFAAFRTKHAKYGEMKWTDVKGKQPYTLYVDLVDLFFTSSVAKHLSFKCLVVAKGDDPSRGSGKIGRDLGFYKAYYTLLRHRIERGSHCHITLDERSSPRADCESDLMSCLNTASARDHDRPYTVKTCRGVSSKADDLIQLADVLCGAVGWAWNGMRSTCVAKPALHAQIVAGLGWRTLERQSTTPGHAKFNVWHYQPRKR
jgi:hypothetical protein